MATSDLVDLILEYGPEGNVDAGRNCSVYHVDDEFFKFIDDFHPEHLQSYTRQLEYASIAYPETTSWREEIPVYGIGETTVVKQNQVQTLLDEETTQYPDNYLQQIRETGLKAAAHNIKLDMSLDNLAIIDGEIRILDINDHEALWTNEQLALHLMGSHLLNSINKWQREQNLYAPQLKKLGQKWKGAV